MPSNRLDDRTWFATYRHELCCDTCPNDDDVFVEMIKAARREGAEAMQRKIGNMVLSQPYGTSYEDVMDVKWEED